MKKTVTPYKDPSSSKKEQVTQMFDEISNKYDTLNRVISLGIDQSWRRKVVKIASETAPQRVLDIATGTGDLAIALKKTNATQIIGLDISPGMLAIGKDKVKALSLDKTITMVLGDSENLSYEDNYFDLVTVAFGVRNFENLEKGLGELFRVLRPQGKLIILETSVPTKFPFKQGYHIYSGLIVPLVGRIFSRDQRAYQYLSDSAAAFPYGDLFNNILRKIGFIEVKDNPQTLGVASIYCATKP
ncbi:bifunctional demethylmenaquinone methyltransferase/2-methoxy-6-polyprenyl-1,4-benzoquinol methylase UbiE [Flavobacteriaceae bacterium]|jgi:demethylmenaquinone methyltransferase/2-methoxy-6-polyprenyl-1,4-benzoquinol methylase|nr:bifunctional demethylmenaquinone methyltransferase/2-methoxy-6-polyprenyl-1,4-benzoquinol methylase UbiE [Flavobacteriaceae bacterium]